MLSIFIDATRHTRLAQRYICHARSIGLELPPPFAARLSAKRERGEKSTYVARPPQPGPDRRTQAKPSNVAAVPTTERVLFLYFLLLLANDRSEVFFEGFFSSSFFLLFCLRVLLLLLLLFCCCFSRPDITVLVDWA